MRSSAYYMCLLLNWNRSKSAQAAYMSVVWRDIQPVYLKPGRRSN